MKILIVDDAPSMRRILKMEFEKMGIADVTEAGDGVEGWAAIEAASPQFDFIVSDWNMPVCTGIDLLKRVRATESTRDLPFIMVTAEGESSYVMEAMKAGVTDYVMKPFTAAILLEKFQKHLKKKKL